MIALRSPLAWLVLLTGFCIATPALAVPACYTSPPPGRPSYQAGYPIRKPDCGPPPTSAPTEGKSMPAEVVADTTATQSSGASEKSEGWYVYWLTPDYAPGPAILMCEGGWGAGSLCEAFPQSDTGSLTYSWSTTGKATLPGPSNPSSPIRTTGCSGGGSGTVTVTVTSPYGLIATRTTGVYCSY